MNNPLRAVEGVAGAFGSQDQLTHPDPIHTAPSAHDPREAARAAIAAAFEDDTLAQVFQRFLEDTLTSALPAQWERRAQTFEDARPKLDDFNGTTTDAELAERDLRLATTAAGCRLHAALLRGEDILTPAHADDFLLYAHGIKVDRP